MSEAADKFCVFQTLPDGRCRCVRGRCGNVLPAAFCTKRVRCKGGRPGPIQLGVNYAKAVVRAGKAKIGKAARPRTKEEIAQIEAICTSNECGLYNAAGGWCEHEDCGCAVKKKATSKMEKCPLGLWPLKEDGQQHEQQQDQEDQTAEPH